MAFSTPAISAPSLKSLFNGKPIDDGAAAIVGFSGRAKTRDWVVDPLRIILTLTNLRGTPYKTNFGDKLSQAYVDHADFIRFALVYPGRTLEEPRPDEMVLAFGTERLAQATSWEQFSEFARATAAFPAGFPARALSRPTEHYRWRAVAYPPLPGEDPHYLLSWPDWDAMIQPGALNCPKTGTFRPWMAARPTTSRSNSLERRLQVCSGVIHGRLTGQIAQSG